MLKDILNVGAAVLVLVSASRMYTQTTTSKGPAIGIDLGTTYSYIEVFQHRKVEIITNDKGN